MYGATETELFAEVIFVEKYRIFKLRVKNRALTWLKFFDEQELYRSP